MGKRRASTEPELPNDPATAQKFLIPRTQRNIAYELIIGQGLDATEFLWQETFVEAVPLAQRPCGIVSKLVHRPTGHYFVFDARVGHRVFYSPGEESAVEYDYPGSWGGAETHLRRWVAVVKKEVSAPDLWANIGGLADFAVSAVESIEGNTTFTPDEVHAVKKRLGEVIEYLVCIRKSDEEFRDFVNSRFDYLDGAVTRVGRKDFLLLLLGVLTSTAVSAHMTGNEVGDLFRFVFSLFSNTLKFITGR